MARKKWVATDAKGVCVMSRNIIVVGKGNSVARLIFDMETKKAKAIDYDGAVSSSVNGATRINNLAVVVRTMEQLAEKDMSENKTVTTFYTVGMVTDMIHRGTFKHWMLNDGKKADGSAVNETELDLWNRFAELYTQLYMHVTFKDVATAKLPRNPRYAISEEQRLLDGYVKSAWERIKPEEPEVLEADGEAF